MIPTVSVKGHRCVVTAHAHQSRALHLISLVGIRESVPATLAAMQSGHSGVLNDGETNLVSFALQNTKVIQGRLPSGAFHAIALGQRVTSGEVILLPEGMPLADRFYRAMLDKSTLPLHSNWQGKLLELAQEAQVLTPLRSWGLQAYVLKDNLEPFERRIRRALINKELAEIGEPTCA